MWSGILLLGVAALGASSAQKVEDALLENVKNPYVRGCLGEMAKSKGDTSFRPGLRVCNSDDPPDAASAGVCRQPEFDYTEIRITSQNWDSVVFIAWIWQILLSELLGVPTSMETGLPELNVNFYIPDSTFGYGLVRDYDALRKSAQESADCTIYRTSSPSSTTDTVHNNNTTQQQYASCSHIVPELWTAQDALDLYQEGVAEAPQSLGVIGVQGWFLPKFTAQRDSSLSSYVGLQGESNRRKLAETFLRPTTWGEYCSQVSNSSCEIPDTVAQRPPLEDEDIDETDKYFEPGVYTGHFRMPKKMIVRNTPTIVLVILSIILVDGADLWKPKPIISTLAFVAVERNLDVVDMLILKW